MKKLALVVPLLLAVPGCPKPRTSAATQPTPAAFDPSQSDPEAIKVVEAGVAALGGAEHWTNLKELQFTIKYTQDGKVQGELTHYWDRWNGRHRLITTDMSTVGGNPDDVKQMDVRYDLFDKGATPTASYGGDPLLRADAVKQVAAAREHLAQDLYFVAMIYKLEEPGVILKRENAEVTVPDPKACKPSCTAIKVTFDPAVGKDTWFVNYNNESHLPEVIELQKGAGRVGYLLEDWTEAGGLKWPGSLHNIGLPGEVIQIEDLKVGEPDDATYMPSVSGGG
ncbi:MAG TPA: hypothetical protein VHE35_25340 [Kofleriaceae bacterium]|nr:hypothetical protein [Kofleriaceae bacterium]